MTETEQVEFLLDIGKRLDNWCSPGDAEDYVVDGKPLWVPALQNILPSPMRVCDLILANCFKIKDFRTQSPVNMLINPAQRHFSAHCSRKNSICKAGRAGFTTYLADRALLRSLTHLGRTAVLISHEQKPSEEYFGQVKFSFDNLAVPFGIEMKKLALRTAGRGGKQNARELYFPVLNSGFRTETAGDPSPAQGSSIQDLLCDEMARWKKGSPRQVFSSITSHVTGISTEIDVFSRPRGSAGVFHDNYHGAKAGTNGYKSFFYAWFWNKFQRVKTEEGFALTEDEQALALRYRRWRAEDAPEDCGLPPELSLSQINWRREQRKESGPDFLQDFAEDDVTCFFGNSNCPFDELAMERILLDQTTVVARSTSAGESENGLLMWREPHPQHRYVVFGDPASTLWTSRDAMQVVDLDTGEQCAEWVGRIDPIGFAAILKDYALRYNKALLAVENNLGKISVTVMDSIKDYDNKYWMQDQKQPTLGWTTDPKTRPSMLSTFGQELQNHPENFHSKRLVAECKNMDRSGNRIAAATGLTDDLVLAMAGALEIRRLGHWFHKPWIETMTPARETNLERTWARM